MKKVFYFAVLCLGLLGVNAAQAAVLTFDDINGVVNDGYGGLNWNNMNVLNAVNYQNSGYKNGLVSGSNVAYNASAAKAVVLSNTDFTFNGAYFTAAWNDGLTVLAEGYKNGAQQYSLSYIIDTLSPIWLSFDFMGIDELRLSSFGGINHGYGGSGAHFAMDNFTYNQSVNAVPVPAAVWLFGSGLMGLLGFNRKRAQSLAA